MHGWIHKVAGARACLQMLAIRWQCCSDHCQTIDRVGAACVNDTYPDHDPERSGAAAQNRQLLDVPVLK